MQVTLGKNLVVPVSLALTIATTLIGYGKTAQRADEVQTRVETLEQWREKHIEESQRLQRDYTQRDQELERMMLTARADLDRRMSVVEAAIASMNATMGRIEGKLDRSLVTTAAGGRR